MSSDAEPLLPLPPAPAYASQKLSPAALAGLTAFGEILATDGIIRGLIGPREVPVLWDRHLLNCAAMAEAVPTDATVADIGTGAGLPGLVLALVRPDLHLILVDTLQRRCEFLEEMVAHFGLADRADVIWGRAETIPPCHADIVTSRAVAALSKLATWCFPHAKIGGKLLAMKGQKATEELTAARKVLHRWGAAKDAKVLTVGADWIDPPVTLVSATRTK